MSITTSMTTTFPVELIMEIFSYLPAKSLINSCKFVCKAWRIVVKDPDFVKMHLNRGAINGGGGGGGGGGTSSSSNNNNNNYQSLMCTSGTELFQLYPPFNFGDVPPNSDSDSDSDSDDHTVIIITETKLDVESFPCRFKYSELSLVGSCNGLLLCINREGFFVVLLNPCTRRYKVLPSEPSQYPYRSESIYYNNVTISYGFGCFYDSTTTIAAEYKVVRIVHNRVSKPEVKVYSMSTNSWRTVKDSISNDINEMITMTIVSRPGVFLNGALHWMGLIIPYIVSFDMRGEEFREMPRPPYDDANTDTKVLMIMRGCLCMIRNRGFWGLDIWVMKEYGVNESWTRGFVMKVSHGLKSIVCLGDQIIINKMCGRLVLYDINKKMSAYIQVNGVPDGRFVCSMVPCTESLVSLKSSVLPLRRMESLDTEIK